MKLVIGVVGENGAGKGSFSSIFVKIAKGKTVSVIRFSDILYKTLDLWNLKTSRVNLQKLPVALNKAFGEGSLTRACEKQVKNQKADVVIVEGVRWLSDVPMIRSFKNNTLVYITANPKTRYLRMKKRGEKAGESKKTYPEFLSEEKAKTEAEIKNIGKMADYKFTNNGKVSDLKRQVVKFYKSLNI